MKNPIKYSNVKMFLETASVLIEEKRVVYAQMEKYLNEGKLCADNLATASPFYNQYKMLEELVNLNTRTGLGASEITIEEGNKGYNVRGNIYSECKNQIPENMSDLFRAFYGITKGEVWLLGEDASDIQINTADQIRNSKIIGIQKVKLEESPYKDKLIPYQAFRFSSILSAWHLMQTYLHFHEISIMNNQDNTRLLHIHETPERFHLDFAVYDKTKDQVKKIGKAIDTYFK